MADKPDTQALWQEYKRTRDRILRDRLILTYAPLVKYVAGAPGERPAGTRRRGRPRLLRPSRADWRDRALRPQPRHQVRDLRDRAHQRVDHRRAPLDGLGAAPVRSRARHRARHRRARGKADRAPTDEEIADKLGITEEEFQQPLLEISRSSIAALDELWSSPGSGGDAVAMIDTIPDEQAPEPQQAMAHTELREALGDAISRCRSGKSSSSRFTTTRS